MTGDNNKSEPKEKPQDGTEEKIENSSSKNDGQKDSAKKEAAKKETVETTKKSAQTESNKAENKKSDSATKTKSSFGVKLVILLLLILLAAIAAGGYFGWQFWRDYTAQQEQRFKAIEAETSNQQASVNTLSNQQAGQVDNQKQALAEIQQAQSILQQRLDSHTQRLRALAGASRDDWLLAEAKYLLRLATQRLLVERSTESVIGLLEAADKILVSVDDSGILPVREAIAKEIIALKLAKTVDRQGVYLQLSALKNQIQELPLIPKRPLLEETSEGATEQLSEENNEATTTAETPWYLSAWKSVKTAFGSLDRFIQIRHHDEAPDLLKSEQEQLQIINNLMLMFEQAQFALLHEDELIYRESMAKAGGWWRAYYSHYPEYEIVFSEIKKLSQVDVIQDMPDITRSTELLTDYIEQFHKLAPEQNLNLDNPTPLEKKSESIPLGTTEPDTLAPDTSEQQANPIEGPQT
jgi:uroporphyrin-3 C-methyltransferase